MPDVCVFGLGFVGLPLALSFAMRGCRVVGVDVDQALVAELQAGVTHHLESYQGTPIQEILRRELAAGRFRPTTDAAAAMAACDNIIVTVGVPVEDGRHDLGPVLEVSRAIAAGLKPGDLVIVRSTLIPGTTRRDVLPVLEQSGLKAGRDFFLAYSSERIAEGRAFHEFEHMPAALAGLDQASAERAAALLSIVTKAEITLASSFEVVEMAKVMENISRDVDIAMVNEFARFARAMGVDIFEVVRVANTHLRVNLLTPGPGVGGYCLPNALFYLLPRARELGVELELLTTARRVNDAVPSHVAGLALRNLPVPPAQARLAVLGIAMKDYSNDDRVSPALAAIRVLQEAGCQVRAYDPAVPTPHPFKVGSLEEALSGAHGVLILALQEGLPTRGLAAWRPLMAADGTPFIVDTRNAVDRAECEAAGFRLETL
ncbi:MAG: nucleotide sugar dehydrogenase [Syntrophomonadaceae bacterium]|nr:nucleotide sugar dehydrogenase [Syntrophomonadaceae bacterium]